MNQQDLLVRIVENAMDFLSQSISEFDDNPKYSVIHFHAAVELFLKARLMAEHWSLAVSKRKDPDWNKFVAGDFISVSMDEAADKLDKVVRAGLTKQELETFRRLTKHRNKMVHFFHEAVSDEENVKLQSSIAIEQLTAWYLLYKVLTDRWDGVFSPWSDELEEIDKGLRKLHEFLQVVFDQLKPEIEKREAGGAVFEVCPSCEFRAQEHIDVKGEPYRAICYVCGLEIEERRLRINCPDCTTPVLCVDDGFGSCEGCGRSFEPENLADILIADGAAHVAAMEGDDSWKPGNCSDCDGYHTVVLLNEEHNKHLCTSCLLVFNELQCCEWCNEPNTGDMEDSYVFGCDFCDGRVGWDSERD